MASVPVFNANSDERELDIGLTQMAAHVEAQLAAALDAFSRRDIANAEKTIVADQRIDEAQVEIERKCLDLLTKGDMAPRSVREVVMVMKVTGELERVGDLAKNVAKRTLVVSRESHIRPAVGVATMGRAALRQFSNVLNAYSEKNIEAAKAVWGGDDDLDELYNSVFREIMLDMMDEPSRINAGTHMAFIAKNFERVGDHATNIAEALHYFITGAPLAISRPKGDETSTTSVTPPRDRDDGADA